MKKRQDDFLRVFRWLLIVFFFGIMFLGFYLNYKKTLFLAQEPQVEATLSDSLPSQNEE